jgi:hypothetical protein
MGTAASTRIRKRELLDGLNSALESEGTPLDAILRKAILLAQLFDEQEYKLLFQTHLDGVDPKSKPAMDTRVQNLARPRTQRKIRHISYASR